MEGKRYEDAEKTYYFLEDCLLRRGVLPIELESVVWEEIQENIMDSGEKVLLNPTPGMIDAYPLWLDVAEIADDLIDVEAYRKRYVDFISTKNYDYYFMKTHNFSIRTLLNLPKNLNTEIYSPYITKR